MHERAASKETAMLLLLLSVIPSQLIVIVLETGGNTIKFTFTASNPNEVQFALLYILAGELLLHTCYY